MINLTVVSFRKQKKAESLDDCQDAFKVNAERARYAVADGATRSFFPKRWADLLVRRFCETPDLALTPENWREWLEPIQTEWYKQVEERVKARNLFYLTNSFSAREPAVSTFIGLEIDRVEGKWEAIIVGDSCLFHKSDSGFKSYPIEKSEDFTSHPAAFASFPERNHDVPTFRSGDIQSGELFILATDALAKWIVQHNETDQLDEALNQLRQIKTDEQFESFVDSARDHKNIRLVNDDVTLMLISVVEPEPSETEEDSEELSPEVPSSENAESQGEFLAFPWVILTEFFGSTVGFIIVVVLILHSKC